MNATTYSLKANRNGSWTNILDCRSEKLPSVRRACEILVEHAEGRVKFKLTSADGLVTEVLDFYSCGWRPLGRG